MRAIRHTLVIFCIMPLSACGMMNDISETKEEVKRSNTNMESMLGKMDQSVTGVDTSNQNMLKLIEQGQGMQDKMQTLIDQGKAMEKKLQESVKAVEQSLQKMDKMTGLSKTLVEQGKALGEKLDASHKEVVKTRKATEHLVAGLAQQEVAMLNEMMRSLSRVVRNPGDENHYRIAAAKTIYKLLAEKNLGPGWYATFVAANIEMCQKRSSQPYGVVCTDKFMGATGRASTIYHETKESLEAIAEESGGIFETIVDHFLEDADRLVDRVPLTPFRPNVVWVLGLRPDTLSPFYEAVIADPKNSQREKSIAFLKFAQGMLLASLHTMAEEKEDGVELPTYKLEAFRYRKGIILAIHQLPGFQDSGALFRLTQEMVRLVEAARARPEGLSDVDAAIIAEIEKGFFDIEEPSG